MKKFLGTIQWMKKFIWGLQKYVGTLTPLTSSKLEIKDFKWGQAEEDVFNNIKRIMTSLPCLKNIDYELYNPIWLFTDASGSGLGAALFQGKDWKQASPIAYKSHLMTPAKPNYPVHEQELLAVVHALQKWKMLLLGIKIHVMTDHHLLTHLLRQRNLSHQQVRWTELLADFDLEFKYIRGEIIWLQTRCCKKAYWTTTLSYRSQGISEPHSSQRRTTDLAIWATSKQSPSSNKTSFGQKWPRTLTTLCQPTKAPTTAPPGKMLTPEFA
jgi:hypothetical protein